MSGTQLGDSGNPVTDPKFIYNNDLNVLAYRMGLVETALGGLDDKLTKVVNEYPTNGTLKLILDPIRNELKELKDKREAEVADKVKNSQQMKYLAIAAVLGPFATFVITAVMANVLGVVK